MAGTARANKKIENQARIDFSTRSAPAASAPLVPVNSPATPQQSASALPSPKIGTRSFKTPLGIPITFSLDADSAASPQNLRIGASLRQLNLHLTHAKLQLLRGFDQLLCLEGLTGIEHLPHQIETVRKVLRRFQGRVLLADEVGLGKTIEACLLLREYLLRSLVRRVLILVPNPLVSQWQAELSEKFHLEFAVPSRGAAGERAEFWDQNERILMATSLAKSGRRPEILAAQLWDLVIVDEAHHCKNQSTKIWQLVNSLQRRHMFLLTATPVQNNLTEIYSLLTLLEPGHLKTESDFKRQYVKRGNPRDPKNRERLRGLLGEVMIRNTRSLVQIHLPPRYAQTIVAQPQPTELEIQTRLHQFLRTQSPSAAPESPGESTDPEAPSAPSAFSRMKLKSLLNSHGSHPATLSDALESLAENYPEAKEIRELARSIQRSAKDEKLLELLAQNQGHKILVFVQSLKTLARLHVLLSETGYLHSVFSGEQSAAEKDQAVADLRERVSVMLCTESGGEGRNLQFADTLINYDLPWNPMRIEQRIGRIHRYGQTQDVFIFNLCTQGSLESRLLSILNDKIRMFEMVVGEVGSILGNLDEGDDFESLVLRMWMDSADDHQLEKNMEALGESLLDAKSRHLDARELDEALFGEEFE